MRPTFLQFRNPRERTPDPYDSKVTYNGKSLEYSKSKSPAFGKGKRFGQYDLDAKKTGILVGPGSYASLKPNKIKGGCCYKPLNAIQGDLKNYFYVGQILVYGKPENISRKTDCEWEKYESRPTSASGKSVKLLSKATLTRLASAKNFNRLKNLTPSPGLN